ncbi:MAG: RecT family recombinase [Myoviridae sp. ctThM1]|nr:MAG: RecT family recombinase [Myoviridae sp. ctThM1]
MLFEQTITADAGSIRFQALTGATEVATFNTTVPIFGKNRMAQRKQPYYTPVITITTHAAPVVFGSGVTGGTVVENTRIVAANATAQQQTVSGGAQSERGLGAGTYYLRLHNFGSGAATGVYSLFWEEKPV